MLYIAYMKKTLLVLFALLIIPSVSLASFDVSLKYGSKGDSVVELQDFLSDQGVYTGKSDGRFGLGTLKAVKAFQTANSLKADGYFGLGSRTKANAILADLLSSSNNSEQAETGTVVTVSGCSSTSLFSATTGQSCTSGTPTTNFPDGCTSLSGFSTTTGMKCDASTQNLINDISQLKDQISQINTSTVVANTSTPAIVTPADTTPPVIISSSWSDGIKQLEINTNEAVKIKVSIFTTQTNTTSNLINLESKTEFIGMNADQIRSMFDQGLIPTDSITVLQDNNFSSHHEIKPTGLIAGVWYQYKLESTDQSGNTSTSWGMFTLNSN